MNNKRAQQLRWEAVDHLFHLYHNSSEILGEDLTEEETHYLYDLAVRVARNFNVRNHTDLPKIVRP